MSRKRSRESDWIPPDDPLKSSRAAAASADEANLFSAATRRSALGREQDSPFARKARSRGSFAMPEGWHWEHVCNKLRTFDLILLRGEEPKGERSQEETLWMSLIAKRLAEKSPVASHDIEAQSRWTRVGVIVRLSDLVPGGNGPKRETVLPPGANGDDVFAFLPWKNKRAIRPLRELVEATNLRWRRAAWVALELSSDERSPEKDNFDRSLDLLLRPSGSVEGSFETVDPSSSSRSGSTVVLNPSIDLSVGGGRKSSLIDLLLCRSGTSPVHARIHSSNEPNFQRLLKAFAALSDDPIPPFRSPPMSILYKV